MPHRKVAEDFCYKLFGAQNIELFSYSSHCFQDGNPFSVPLPKGGVLKHTVNCILKKEIAIFYTLYNILSAMPHRKLAHLLEVGQKMGFHATSV